MPDIAGSKRSSRRLRTYLFGAAFLLIPILPSGVAADLDFHLESLELPGAPVAVVSTDLDGDGRRDLAVAVVYTVWDQIALEERTEMDGIEGLVEVLTIVPALLDHRQLFLFRSDESGRYLPLAEPLDLETSILSIEAGPGGRGLIALTDDGVARLVLPRGEAGEEAAVPAFETVIAEPPVLAGTGAFFPPLGLVRELDGEPGEDLLLPAAEGFSLYLNHAGRLGPEPVQRTILPRFDELPTTEGDSLVRLYPLPEVRDTDADGRPDLLFPHPQDQWSVFHRARGLGGGRFATLSNPLDGFPPLEEAPAPPPGEEEDGEKDGEEDEEAVLFDDLDGDGRAELVTQQQLERDAKGVREEMDEARRPDFRYRIYPQAGGGTFAKTPRAVLEATGYALAGDPDFPFPGGFQDLDGDGRKDLVTLTLDFSLMQAVKVLTTQRISIGLDFHVWCQLSDGSGFQPVPGLDLSGKFKLNLRNLRLNQLSQFAGDFDGDGRADFLQIGRGKRASIHLGREGCSYPSRADQVVELAEEPQDLSLVQVRDLDGDDRSDLVFIQPRKPRDEESSIPVRLHLYLSGGRNR